MGVTMRRAMAVVAWLLAGHAALAALYWALLNLPESNVAMLGGSALLLVVIVAGAGVVQAQALLQLATDLPWRARVRPALAGPLPFLVALAVWLVVSWLCGWIGARHEAYRGEIDAWFIAHGDWTNVAWLHRTIEWILSGGRYGIGTSLAVALLAAGVLGGLQDVVRLRWVRASLSPARLLVVGIILALLIWLPWRAAWWRPQFLPATIVEPIVALLKLSVLAAVMHVGWTLILARAASGYVATPTPRIVASNSNSTSTSGAGARQPEPTRTTNNPKLWPEL